ncbi:hypothetical protein [Paenibacillus humicola]|uniref:hypothetical protein n=1 Tax=Paenibacillus humicola TaxID=3110540 RepID=UPI00237A1146|nr:hypothetical protein [Paenibacillus humicola]
MMDSNDLRGGRHARSVKSKLTAAAGAFIAAVLLLGAAACGNANPSNNMNAKSYGHDGYMGLSNSNPHLPNPNGNQLNYGDDARFAERKLKEIGGVQRVSMTIFGTDLYVSIEPKPGVDEAQLRNEAIAVLRFNMPRYNVHVKTGRK